MATTAASIFHLTIGLLSTSNYNRERAPAYTTLHNHFLILHTELEGLKVHLLRMFRLNPLEESTFGYYCMLCKIAVEIALGIFHAGEFVNSLLALQG
jgi:hypothetical protein